MIYKSFERGLGVEEHELADKDKDLPEPGIYKDLSKLLDTRSKN